MFYVDLDYLVDSLDELTEEIPTDEMRCRKLIDYMREGLSNINNGLDNVPMSEQMRIMSKLDTVMSRKVFPSLAVYSLFYTFPGVSGTNIKTSNAIGHIINFTRSEDLLNMFYVKNIDNDLSSMLDRICNYIEILSEYVMNDIVSSRFKEVDERLLIALSLVVEDPISHFYNELFDDYECDLMSESDYTSIVNQFDKVLEHLDDDFIERSANLLMLTRTFMFKKLQSVIQGGILNTDPILHQLHQLGKTYVSLAGKYMTLSIEDSEKFALDYRDEMYVSTLSTFNFRFVERYLKYLRREMNMYVNTEDKLRTFRKIVQIFKTVVIGGRDENNVRRYKI